MYCHLPLPGNHKQHARLPSCQVAKLLVHAVWEKEYGLFCAKLPSVLGFRMLFPRCGHFHYIVCYWSLPVFGIKSSLIADWLLASQGRSPSVSLVCKGHQEIPKQEPTASKRHKDARCGKCKLILIIFSVLFYSGEVANVSPGNQRYGWHRVEPSWMI